MNSGSGLRALRLCAMVAVVAGLGLGGCAVIGNRFETQIPREPVALGQNVSTLPRASDTLKVTTWNLGYGGMGAEADFVFDGGKQRRPLNATLVDRNIARIAETISGFDADVLLFQEAARPSWSNYGRDLVETLDRAAEGRQGEFHPDILTRGVPRPFRIEIGNATYYRHQPAGYELVALPLEPYFEFGLFRKNYRIHVLRLEGPVSWTVGNIHLSTFDPEDVDVRRQQVGAVLEFAQAEFAAGRHVVIGGDWNLVLSQAAFAHTTDEVHSFWVRDFPMSMLPEGWTIAADPGIPTVRLAHAPYTPGVNRTIAIDGFLVSPNVDVRSVQAQDLGFVWSDHNPVTGTFAAN